MANTVFILGAGASKQAGAPLMAEFLDFADDLLRHPGKEVDKDSFERVRSGRNALGGVLAKAFIDIHNVESVFSAFELARILGRFGDDGPEEIEKLSRAMKKVIAQTIGNTLGFPMEKNGPRPPVPYEAFTELLKQLLGRIPPVTVAVITFNYDVGVDTAFYCGGFRIHYGLEQEEVAGRGDGVVPLLKLHGSLNWWRCEKCRKVIVWPVSEIWRLNWMATEGHGFVDVSRFFGTQKHDCAQEVSPEPLIVPPTWNKGEHSAALKSVWTAAAKELSDAENIVVCGYSLPATDSFFRYLYALGTFGKTTLKKFLVCDPQQVDAVDSADQRFRALLGPGAMGRYEYIRNPFNLAIGNIGDLLKPRW